MTIYYIIWFVFFFCLWSLYLCFYLSLCLCRVSLFLTLTQSHYLISDPLPIYYALLAKNFPNFTIFFLSLVPIIVQLPVKKQLNIFSLSYLYNIRERVTNTEWQRVTKPKKKKKKTTGIDSIHNHQHQFITISKNTNTTSPQAQIVRFWDSQIIKNYIRFWRID